MNITSEQLTKIDLEENTRKHLYGSHKKTTIRSWLNEILKLGSGDPDRHLVPQTKVQIAMTLGISRPTLDYYISIGVAQKFFELDTNGKFRPAEITTEDRLYADKGKAAFLIIPEVSKFVINLQARRSGKGVKNWSDQVSAVRVICKTIKKKPVEFTISTEQSTELWQLFVSEVKHGRIQLEKKRKFKTDDISTQLRRYKSAIRNFCAVHQVSFIDNDPIMGNKIVAHAQYGHIKLKHDEEVNEYELADQYIKDNFTKFSEEFMVLKVGIQGCPRNKALIGMALDWEKIDSPLNDGNFAFVMEAHETKTEDRKIGAKFDKYIIEPETQEVLKEMKKRGFTVIWKNGTTARSEQLTTTFRALWKAIGKIPDYDECVKKRKEGYKKTGNYFFDEPIHSLRHIGAHYWLQKTDYDYGTVATVGGWATIDELKSSYGKKPKALILQAIFKAIKKKN